MQEPKIHSKIDPFLPEGHWLEEYMEAHHDTGVVRLSCVECGYDVYRQGEGTVLTWVETGWIYRGHETRDYPGGEPEAGVMCIWCFAHQDGQNGLTPTDGWINPAWALNDDGSPQPMHVGVTNDPGVERKGGQPPLPRER